MEGQETYTDPIKDANVDDIVQHTGPITQGAIAGETTTEEPPATTTTSEPEVETSPENTETETSVYEDTARTDDGTTSTEDTTATEETADTTGDTQEETESGEEPETTTETEVETTQPVDFSSQIHELTNGAASDVDSLKALINEYNEIKQRPVEPQFATDAQRQLYDFASQFKGNELAAAKSALHVMSLDIDQLTEKEKMFEDFRLDEENSDLSPREAAKIFDEIYERKYGDAENDIVIERERKVAVRKAEKNLQDLQSKIISTESQEPSGADEQQSQEQLEAISAAVDQSFNEFKGLAIPTSQDGDGSFNFMLDDSMKTQAREVAKNPNQWLQNVVNQFYDENSGKFDYEGYTNRLVEFQYSDQIREAAYKQGLADGKQAHLKSLANPSKPAPNTPEVPTPKKGSDQDQAWDHLVDIGVLPGVGNMG